MGGKKHKRAMKHVGRDLHSYTSMKDFFTYVDEKYRPDLDKLGAVDALKEYIERAGGDPNWTINHPDFVPPPPPGHPDVEQLRRPTIKCCTRTIVSSTYAKKYSYAAQGICRERILCCWDDPKELGPTCPSKCIRDNCPYRHSTALLAEGPKADFFTMIPCTFAGMAEGCKYHSKRLGTYDDWFVEPFELEEPTKSIGVTTEWIDSVVEQVLVFDGCKWCKREVKINHTNSAESVLELQAALCAATEQFLDGFGSEGSADDG